MSAISTPTVFVVDDDQETRSYLNVLLKTASLPARLFSSAEELLAAITPDQPGCVVLDLRMPGMTGLQLQEELVRRGFSLPIIILSGSADVAMVVAAMQAGAISVLEKPCGTETLIAHIQKALDIDAQRRREHQQIAEIREKLKSLNEGEKAVLDLLCAGYNNWRIAGTLHISRQTTEMRRARLMRKLGVDSLPELIRLALRAGLDPEAPPADPAAN